MQVRVLGPLELRDDDGSTVELRGPRLRALLVRLALAAGRPVSADALAGALWDDTTPADAGNAVQSLISRLRRALPDPRLVQSHPGGYRLLVARKDVDALLFRDLVRDARAAPEPGPDHHPTAADLRQRALALWRGPAFADLEAPFVPAERTVLEAERRAADDDRIATLIAAGKAAAVLPELTAMVAGDPLREPTVALLMTALYDLGQSAAALRAYEELRTALADELGTDPSRALQDLHLQLLRGERIPPQPRSAPAYSNLPARLTTFVGRRTELERLRMLLVRERLVTLVGPGGAGKTRLAVETVASRSDTDLPATLVELAPVTDPADLAQAVLDALGLREQRVLDSGQYLRRDARTRVRDALAAGPRLLLLDNCEHLVDAAAELAAELLAHCPQLQVVATSREPLALTGEIVFPVPTLPQPPADASLEQTAATASAQLFVDRARAAAPGFALDEATHGAVAELCRRLDGLPLAIELAAARLRTLTVDQIAARLDDRFRLLTGATRTSVARHRTLRAVVEWSWELLDGDELRAADRFAVFAAGATVAAARAVCADDGTSLAQTEDTLARLTDKSLLQLVGTTAPARYRMLETLREYGTERLADQDELTRTRRRHARYYRDLAESLEPQLRTGAQLGAIATLDAERDNLLAALRFAADDGDAETAVRIAAALGWYWVVNDHHAEAVTWTELALGVPGPRPAEATALVSGLYLVNALATDVLRFDDRAAISRRFAAIPDVDSTGSGSHPLLVLLGPASTFLAEPRGDFDAAVEAAMAHPDPWAKGILALLRSQLAENSGDTHVRRTAVVEALEWFRRTGDRWGMAMSLHGLGNASLLEDDLAGAREAYAQALRLIEELTSGASDEVELTLRLAAVETRAGDRRRARELVARAAVAAERNGSRQDMCMVAAAQALAHLEESDVDAAATALERAEEMVADTAQTAPQLQAHLRCVRVLVLLAQHADLGQAWDVLRAAFEHARPAHDMPVLAVVAVVAAHWMNAAGRHHDAARLLGWAAAIRGATDGGDPVVAAASSTARTELGDREFDRAYAAAAALDRSDAVAALTAVLTSPTGPALTPDPPS